MAHIVIVTVKQPSLEKMAEWESDFVEWSEIDPRQGEQGQMYNEQNNWHYKFIISDGRNNPRDYGSKANAASMAAVITAKYPNKVFAFTAEKNYPMGQGPGYQPLDEPMDPKAIPGSTEFMSREPMDTAEWSLRNQKRKAAAEQLRIYNLQQSRLPQHLRDQGEIEPEWRI